MNIVITNAYSLEQKGDSALLVGTIKQLRQTFAKASIWAQVTAQTQPGDTYEGAKLLDSVVYIALAPDIAKLWRPVRMAYTLAAGMVWAWTSRLTGRNQRWMLTPRLRRSLDAMWEADLIVPVAGGYLAGTTGLAQTVNLVYVLLPIWISHALRKPVVHYAQSIGPLGNNFQRWLVGRVLRRARLVITRESVSTQFTLGLGVPRAKVRQSIDVGFLFEPAEGFKLRDAFEAGEPVPSSGKPVVGITTKDHLPGPKQAAYEEALARFCDWLTGERGLQVVFVPQITSAQLHEDDRILSRRVYGLMKHTDGAFLIEKNLTNYQTKAVIEQLDYMVGTRFHGVIFALTGYVPSIAIEYEHKTKGIMRDLDLEKWIIAMDAVTAPGLIALFEQLTLERQAFLDTLHRNLPEYLNQAAAARRLVKATYELD